MTTATTAKNQKNRTNLKGKTPFIYSDRKTTPVFRVLCWIMLIVTSLVTLFAFIAFLVTHQMGDLAWTAMGLLFTVYNPVVGPMWTALFRKMRMGR